MIAYGFPAGVYVSSVINGSGAQAAGISEGDIITEVDGTKVTGMSDLKAALKSYSAGDKVTFTVARQNGNKYETSSVDVTLSAASQLQAVKTIAEVTVTEITAAMDTMIMAMALIHLETK